MFFTHFKEENDCILKLSVCRICISILYKKDNFMNAVTVLASDQFALKPVLAIAMIQLI